MKFEHTMTKIKLNLAHRRKENVSYEVYGVQTAIETFFWDFYGAGLRMLSAEAWMMATEFIRAQNNVLKEFRQEGLL